MAPTCHEVQGDLEHLLVSCPALNHTRHRLHSLWCKKTLHLQPLQFLIFEILGSPPAVQVKFILDCMSCLQLRQLVELYGQSVQDLILYLTRTWAYSIHRQKMILLGRWPASNHVNQVNTLAADRNLVNENDTITNDLFVSGVTSTDDLTGPGQLPTSLNTSSAQINMNQRNDQTGTTHTASIKQISVSTEYLEQLEIAGEVLGMVAVGGHSLDCVCDSCLA